MIKRGLFRLSSAAVNAFLDVISRVGGRGANSASSRSLDLARVLPQGEMAFDAVVREQPGKQRGGQVGENP